MDTTVLRATPSTRDEQERQLLDLQKASQAGELDQVGLDAVEYLVSQLPEGYALDEENRVVRLDPSPTGSLPYSCHDLRRGLRPCTDPGLQID